jgi:hypothetical protein
MMWPRGIKPQKVLQVITSLTAPCATQGTALQAPTQPLQRDLEPMRRRVGRQCRGLGPVCVTLVRRTATPWLELGEQGLPLARAAPGYLHGATPLSADQQARLTPQLTAARDAQHRIAHHSRRLPPGKAWSHGTLGNADAPTMAPMCQGHSHCPAPCGRKPGRLAEPAAGFIVALHLPGGHPRDASDVDPFVDTMEQAITRVRTRPTPAIPSLAGDLARTDAAWREALQARGIRTGRLPHTVDPLPPSPTPKDVVRILDEADWRSIRTPSQGHLACACGDSRPVVESLMASRLCRGAARLLYKGHRGAIVHTGMAVIAHYAAPLVRIHAYRLSKRARMVRRRLLLRCRQVNQCNAPIH